MAIIIKTPAQIEKMKIAGALAAEVLEMITPYVVPGVTTDKLNTICHNYIVNVQKAHLELIVVTLYVDIIYILLYIC